MKKLTKKQTAKEFFAAFNALNEVKNIEYLLTDNAHTARLHIAMKNYISAHDINIHPTLSDVIVHYAAKYLTK